ncbi:MAG TPA: molybdenum cofactor guanylyltransferase [Allosphingosinicella sp.]|nr:molybdenum cofactor guanylyltransferase [Allosphingosinicella sp.]
MRPAILILAGGQGRRMGGDKALRRLGGRTLLERAVERALGWSDEVAVAVREPGQVRDPGVPLLVDPPGLEGPLGGLSSAVRLQGPVILTMPCDTPFLPDDLPERLAAALPGHGVALAASAGCVHPVCGLWRRSGLGRVEEYAATGRRSLIGFAELIGYSTVEWPEDAFFNVNTPGDLAEAEARLHSED